MSAVAGCAGCDRKSKPGSLIALWPAMLSAPRSRRTLEAWLPDPGWECGPMPEQQDWVTKPKATLSPARTSANALAQDTCGLGGRPSSFKQPIPSPRQRTRDHRASLFFYKIARTTLLCNQVWRPSTCYNCGTIGPIGRPSSAWRAGLSRRFGAYRRHRAAIWPTCPSRSLASPRRAGAALLADPACELLASDPRKA